MRIGMNGNDDMVAGGREFCLCKRLGLECKKKENPVNTSIIIYYCFFDH